MYINVEDVYNIGELYFTHGISPIRQIFQNANARDVIDEITHRIARHNAVSYCHPVDSLLAVMSSIDENGTEDVYRNESIIDDNLPGFMLNTVCVMFPLIAYHMDCGDSYMDALSKLYLNGTMDFFAGAGRHLASEDPEEALDSLLNMNR